ncbi:MAG: phytanoyl-CoA dioxygenase family protein [Byssovorax sp.]
MPAEYLLPGAVDLDLAGPLAHFAEHGYARLGPVLSDEGAKELGARVDQLMMGEIVYPGLFFQKDTETGSYDDLEYKKGYQGPSLNYRKIEKLEKDPLFFAWINNPLFERVARAVYQGEIAIYRALIFNKARTGGTVLPYHQDGGIYWGLDRDPVLQIWTALDDTPLESGCVEILPGSHHKGFATPLGGLIPKDIALARGGERDTVFLPARRGEAILIHNQVWHRSGVNRTGEPRRAFTVCYISAETRCLRKKRAPRSFVRVFDRGVTAAGSEAPSGSLPSG